MDRRDALSRFAPDGGQRLDQGAVGGDGERTQTQILLNQKDGQQALKEKREQWTALNAVLSGLWKGQNV